MPDPMTALSYEVTAVIREDLRDAFESFMIEIHIPEVMETGSFTDARFSTIEPGRYKASYTARSREVLDKYLAEHSPLLRENVAKHFPEGVEFSREEWAILASF